MQKEDGAHRPLLIYAYAFFALQRIDEKSD